MSSYKTSLKTLFFLFLSIPYSTIAQEEKKPFFQFSDLIHFSTNPAGNIRENNKQLSFLYSQNAGDFSAIRSFYINGAYQFQKKHTFFLDIYNDQTGPYFQKNRAYLGYNITINLNKELEAKLGVSGGFVNYNMIGSSGGAGGSDLNFDGSLGLLLTYQKDYFLGLVAQQISKENITPIDYTFQLQRYFEIQGGFKKSISPFVEINFLARVNSLGNWSTYAYTTIQEVLLLGINYHSENILAPKAGFKFIDQENTKASLLFSYAFPIQNAITRINRFEIGVCVN